MSCDPDCQHLRPRSVSQTPAAPVRLKSVLSGARRDAARLLVVVNAAAALHVGGLAEDLSEGVRLAEQSIDGGAAQGKLEELIRISSEAR